MESISGVLKVGTGVKAGLPAMGGKRMAIMPRKMSELHILGISGLIFEMFVEVPRCMDGIIDVCKVNEGLVKKAKG